MCHKKTLAQIILPVFLRRGRILEEEMTDNQQIYFLIKK